MQTSTEHKVQLTLIGMSVLQVINQVLENINFKPIRSAIVPFKTTNVDLIGGQIAQQSP